MIAAVVSIVVAGWTAQTAPEESNRRTVELGHKPYSWLPMTSAPQVSGIFRYDAITETYVVDETAVGGNYPVDRLPTVVKLDLALARERRAAAGGGATYPNLKAELDDSLDFSKYELYNRYVPADRLPTWKAIWGQDKDFSWWGNCNGSAAAAIMEKVPENDLMIQGIRFSVRDFKKLYAISYNGSYGREYAGAQNRLPAAGLKEVRAALQGGDRAQSRLVAGKYLRNLDGKEIPDSWEDKHVRGYLAQLVEAAEDMDPVRFHRFVTEHIDRGEAVVLDRSMSEVVWNYAVSGYQMNIHPSQTPPPPGKGARAQDVTLELAYGDYHDYSWKGGHTYTYRLFQDASGATVGGEWTGTSIEAHPDFGWRPREGMSAMSRRLPAQREAARIAQDGLTQSLTDLGLGGHVRRLEIQDYPFVARRLFQDGQWELGNRVLKVRKGEALTLHYARLHEATRDLQFRYAADIAPPLPEPEVEPLRGVLDLFHGLGNWLRGERRR